MLHPQPDILNYLGQLLAHAYCHYHVQATMLTKMFMRHHLIQAIADHWHFASGLLPDEETFYHALRFGECGNATMEKLALLYFAVVEKWSPAQVQTAILGMMKRKKLGLTPYWDRFVKKYEKHFKKTQHSTLPPHLHNWLTHLSDKDYNKLMREVMKRKKGK